MKYIVFILFCLFNINAFADEALKDYPYQDWDITEHNVYTNPSFIYFNQNPFPTCYALIANILIDLYECDKNSSFCKKRSSFLESALIGEVKDPNQKRELQNGGNTLLILNEIRKSKTVSSYESCNYTNITHNFGTAEIMETSFNNLEKTIHDYYKYEKYSPYLAQYYKKNFLKQLSTEFYIKNEDGIKLLDKNMDKDRLYGYILMYSCLNKKTYSIEPYKINTFINKSAEENRKKMNELIEQKIPFAVSFCLNQKTSTLTKDNDCKEKHIIIVNGNATIKNNHSNEEKKMLNVINTWGQIWQIKTNSLIDYDNFMDYIYPSLIWISQP